MFTNVRAALQQELQEIQDAGLYKKERVILTPQGPEIATAEGGEVLNFCANNYLGLSSHPQVVETPRTRRSSRRPWRPFARMATACHPCALFAAPRTSTKN